MPRCYYCGHHVEDGEIYLVIFNRTGEMKSLYLCKRHVKELLEENNTVIILGNEMLDRWL